MFLVCIIKNFNFAEASSHFTTAAAIFFHHIVQNFTFHGCPRYLFTTHSSGGYTGQKKAAHATYMLG